MRRSDLPTAPPKTEADQQEQARTRREKKDECDESVYAYRGSPRPRGTAFRSIAALHGEVKWFEIFAAELPPAALSERRAVGLEDERGSGLDPARWDEVRALSFLRVPARLLLSAALPAPGALRGVAEEEAEAWLGVAVFGQPFQGACLIDMDGELRLPLSWLGDELQR